MCRPLELELIAQELRLFRDLMAALLLAQSPPQLFSVRKTKMDRPFLVDDPTGADQLA